MADLELIGLKAETKDLEDVGRRFDTLDRKAAKLDKGIQQLSSRLTRLNQQLRQIKQASDALDRSFTRLNTSLRTPQMRNLNNTFLAMARNIANLQKNMVQLNSSYATLARATQRVSNAQAQMANQALASHFVRVNQTARTATTGVHSFRSSLLTTNNVLLNSTTAVQGLLAAFGFREIVRANQDLETFRNTIRVSSDGPIAYARNLDFLKEAGDRVGVAIRELGTPFARFVLAGTSAGFTVQMMREDFEKLTGAARNFGLTSANVQGVVRALEQSLSKGQFMAEEVRLQLGDRLPIAMQAMARATGKTTAELNKMFEQGELMTDKYFRPFVQALFDMSGGQNALARSSQSMTAELGRLSNAFLFAAEVIGENGFNQAVIDASKSIREFLGSAEGIKILSAFGQALGFVAQAFALIATNADVAVAALAFFAGGKIASALMGIGTAAIAASRDLSLAATAAKLLMASTAALGGPVGFAIIGTASAVAAAMTYLATQTSEAEERQNELNVSEKRAIDLSRELETTSLARQTNIREEISAIRDRIMAERESAKVSKESARASFESLSTGVLGAFAKTFLPSGFIIDFDKEAKAFAKLESNATSSLLLIKAAMGEYNASVADGRDLTEALSAAMNGFGKEAEEVAKNLFEDSDAFKKYTREIKEFKDQLKVARTGDRVALENLENEAKAQDMAERSVRSYISANRLKNVTDQERENLLTKYLELAREQVSVESQLKDVKSATETLSNLRMETRGLEQVAAAYRESEQAGARMEAITKAQSEAAKNSAVNVEALAQAYIDQAGAQAELEAVSMVRNLTLENAAQEKLAKAVHAGARATKEINREIEISNIRRNLLKNATEKNLSVILEETKAYADQIKKRDEIIEQIENETVLRGLYDEMLTAQRELELLGLTERERRKNLALFEKELELRDRGIDLTEEQARKELRYVKQIQEARNQAERAQEAAAEIEQSFTRAFDRIGESITQAFANGQMEAIEFGNLAKAVASEILQSFMLLSTINPLKNAILGTDLPTLGSLGSSATSQQAGSGGFMGNVAGLGNLMGSGGGIYNSIALSSFGQTLGLSAAAPQATAAAMAGLEGAGSGIFSSVAGVPGVQLTGFGQALGAGIQASPWGILGSLGANALGLGGGIGGTVGGIVGSIGGGAAGSAILGSILGAAGGPVGAILGSFLGTAIGGLFGNSKPSDYTASFQGVLGEKYLRTEDKANDETRGIRDQGMDIWTTTLTTLESSLGATLPKIYADFAFGSRDGFRAWLFGLDEEGNVDRSNKLFESKYDSIDQQMSSVLQEVLKRSEGLSDNVRTVLDSVDFVEVGLERAGQLLGFAETFDTAIKAMSTGSLDFSEIIEGEVKNNITSTLEAIKTFKRDTKDAGLDIEEASKATKAYVEILLGIRDAEAESISAVENGWRRLEAILENIQPLIDEVGISFEDATKAIEEAKVELGQNFTNQVRRTFMGIPDALDALIEGFETSMKDAELLAGGGYVNLASLTAQLTAINNINLDRALSGLDATTLNNIILYYSVIERNQTVVDRATLALDRLNKSLVDIDLSDPELVGEGLRDVMKGQLQAIGEYLTELERTNEEWGRIAQTLFDTRRRMRQDVNLTTLSPLQRVEEARAYFDSVSEKALAGDIDALNALSGASEELLNASRDYYASSMEYYQDFAKVQDILEQAQQYSEDQLTVSDEQLIELRKQYERLNAIVNGQTRVITDIQTMIALLMAIEANIGKLNVAPIITPSNPNSFTETVPGSGLNYADTGYVRTIDDVVAGVPRAVRDQVLQQLGVTQSGGGYVRDLFAANPAIQKAYEDAVSGKGYTYTPSFNTGGSFVVDAFGGIDSSSVRFKATPGEIVTIQRPDQINRTMETATNANKELVDKIEELINVAKSSLNVQARAGDSTIQRLDEVIASISENNSTEAMNKSRAA